MKKTALYQKSYGAWAGNPTGHAPDYSRCCVSVRSKGRWPHNHQCARPCGHGPDEAYCKQHDPAAVAARTAQINKRNKEKWRERLFEIYGKHFYDALVKIAEGHNDPRSLAKETLKVLK